MGKQFEVSSQWADVFRAHRGMPILQFLTKTGSMGRFPKRATCAKSLRSLSPPRQNGGDVTESHGALPEARSIWKVSQLPAPGQPANLRESGKSFCTETNLEGHLVPSEEVLRPLFPPQKPFS